MDLDERVNSRNKVMHAYRTRRFEHK